MKFPDNESVQRCFDEATAQASQYFSAKELRDMERALSVEKCFQLFLDAVEELHEKGIWHPIRTEGSHKRLDRCLNLAVEHAVTSIKVFEHKVSAAQRRNLH